MAFFLGFAVFVGLVGSILVGAPAFRILKSEWQQCARSQRDVFSALCRTSAIATTLSIATWSLPQFQIWSAIAAPSPEEAIALLKVGVVIGLTPGLSLLSAGLTSLFCSRI
jgi:hypothetical protein